MQEERKCFENQGQVANRGCPNLVVQLDTRIHSLISRLSILVPDSRVLCGLQSMFWRSCGGRNILAHPADCLGSGSYIYIYIQSVRARQTLSQSEFQPLRRGAEQACRAPRNKALQGPENITGDVQ